MLPIIADYANKKPAFELGNLSYPQFEQDISKLLLNIENGSKRISSVIANLREGSPDQHGSYRIWVDLSDVIGSVISIYSGKISESVKSFIKHVSIAVSDNGQGMDEITQSRIFDPFYTTQPPEGGTGLGLFVCHTLAERMAGHIKVESVPGEGSKFVLILPIDDQDRAAAMKAEKGV